MCSMTHSIRGMDVVSPAGRTVRLTYAPDGEPAACGVAAARAVRCAPRRRAAAAGVEVREGVTVREPILEEGTSLWTSHQSLA